MGDLGYFAKWFQHKMFGKTFVITSTGYDKDKEKRKEWAELEAKDKSKGGNVVLRGSFKRKDGQKEIVIERIEEADSQGERDA